MIVLDPNTATDIRLVQLRLELAPGVAGLRGAMRESQFLFVLPLLVLAERRITTEQVGVLRYLFESVPPEPTEEQKRHFRAEYWGQIAKGTRNALFGHSGAPEGCHRQRSVCPQVQSRHRARRENDGDRRCGTAAGHGDRRLREGREEQPGP
jgi:hypothetical protein